MGFEERPKKRTRLLSDASESASDSSVPEQTNGFKINAEYAQRFEHNKKREELHRLEEKFGPDHASRAKRGQDAAVEDDEEESTDESEDDDADLATADLDQEIFSTLQAIKSKDPRVYDTESKFYAEFDPDAVAKDDKKSEKPMYLQDYHRENLLSGYAGAEDADAEEVPKTYQQEQDALKQDVLRAMHNPGNDDDNASEDEDNFLVAKAQSKPAVTAATTRKGITVADVETADRDPETFLSNFMAARAWLPTDGSRFQAFESDDSDEDARAEAVEEAYNLRYENPELANEKLKSFARDVGKYGVRREEKSSRKKTREREQEKKDSAKKEREDERARLRKLRVEEAEDKVKRIKEAAGIQGQELDLDQWRDVIEGDFDDDRWEQEMSRRFGESYYAAQEHAADSEDEDAGSKKQRLRKPKWDDDIDIDDIVPEEEHAKFTLTSDDEAQDENDEDDDAQRKSRKEHLRDKAAAKRAARKERQKIEEIVETTLPLELIAGPAGSSKATTAADSAQLQQASRAFRYRATSPTSFGMTSRDILFAEDAQLNQFAGLKKMAAWRDEGKKARDRKKLSKKARLKAWRKDTFGGVGDAPEGGFEVVLGGKGAGEQLGKQAAPGQDGAEGGTEDGERKKKRRRKSKKKATEVALDA